MPPGRGAAVHSEAVQPGAPARGAALGGGRLALTADAEDLTPLPSDVQQNDLEGEDEDHAQVQFLGQYLLSRGRITYGQLEAALDYQESINLPIGALALSKGYLSEKQLLHVHSAQWNSDKKFGEIAVRKGFMTRAQLDELLREQKEGRVFLGQALVEQGALASDVLESELARYKESQQVAEAQVREDLRGLPDFLLVSPAVQLTNRLLLRMGGVVAKVAAVSPDTRLQPFDYVFWQEVTGNRPFTYALSLFTPDLLDLTEAMLFSMGDDTEVPEEVNLVVLDVGKEFVNILVGHVCTWLSREGINCMPLPPEAAEGDASLPVSWEGETRTVHVRLLMARGELALTLLCPVEPPEVEDDFIDPMLRDTR